MAALAFQTYHPAMGRDGCSTLRQGMPCMYCDFFRPNDSPRNKNERKLWPRAKSGTVCAKCGKRYDEHTMDRRLHKAVVCGGESYILEW
ncbi:hypothetical protein BE21_17885 [Sorangium cellulosum]|uniref:Uncharacterized protein n=1 Tax=Sorangium cellulosum TaxID=56 RepID=A0A150TY89_SORCE|nr:hypothetical protein BE21_17885 [Sorangium cellulosum]